MHYRHLTCLNLATENCANYKTSIKFSKEVNIWPFPNGRNNGREKTEYFSYVVTGREVNPV